MVQVLFFVREETSDDIVIRIVWSKGIHNNWFSLALRPPHVGLVKYTSLNVGGQGDKLAEPLPLQEVPQCIGLGGTDIDITDD